MSTSELVSNVESLNLKDDAREIIFIKPVEIEHTRDYDAPVVLAARNGEDIRPRLANYSINGEFLRPARVNKWVMVFLFDKQAVVDLALGEYTFEDIKTFAAVHIRYGRDKGVKVRKLSSIHCIPAQATAEKNVETMSSQDLRRDLRQLFITLNEDLVDHAMIILPDNEPSWVQGHLQYLEACKWDRKSKKGDSPGPATDKLMRTSRVRLKTLVNLGIDSSWILTRKLWHKYNIKLGGLAVCLKRTRDTRNMEFLNDGHLIISIDLVNLDDQQFLVSAAVGMWDLASEDMSFHTQTRVQAKSMNERADLMPIKDLEQMTAEILAAYKKCKNNQIPTRVIVFRAGGYKAADNDFVIQEIVSIKRALCNASTAQEAPGDQLKDPDLTYLKLFKKKLKRKYSRARPAASSGAIETGSQVNIVVGSELEKSGATPRESPLVVTPVVNWEPRTARYYSNLPSSHMHKLYDDANMSDIAVKTMVHALSFLSPKNTVISRPTPIELSDLAGERTHNIVMAWMDENNIKPEDPEFIPKVNQFLAYEMGDSTYKDHLYYA